MPQKYDYSRARKTADRLLAKFGVDPSDVRKGYLRATVNAPGPAPTGDPWNPQSFTPGRVTTDYPVTVAVVDYQQIEKSGTNILQKDKRALISAQNLAVEPDETFRLVLTEGDSTLAEYQIVSITELAPAGVAVLYDAQVRE